MMERKEGSMKGGDDDDNDGMQRGGNGDIGNSRREIREETHRSAFAISGCSPVSADI
jgi:hypothetical protein